MKMWKQVIKQFGCILALGLLVACGSAPDAPNTNTNTTTSPPTSRKPDTECWTAADCGQGHTCKDGKCNKLPAQSGCTSDQDCGRDEMCTRGQCIAKTPTKPCTQKQEVCNGIDDNCNGSADEGATCPSGQSCMRGSCQATPRYCRTNDGCNRGEACVRGICQTAPTPPGCSSSADCGRGETCVRGTCQTAPTPPGCQSDSDCGRGETCVHSTCQPSTSSGCRSDADCGRGESCVRGTCQQSTPSGCRSDADCTRGQTCVRGTCQQSTPSGCSSDSDCGRGETCIRATCQPSTPSTCRSDSDCGRDETCIRATCVAKPQERCNGVDDNNDGQIDENACSGSCKFPMELTFQRHKYSVTLKLNPTNGTCDPNNNASILQFQSSHAGSAVILSSGWSLLSTTSGKVYNGSILMNFGLGKRVTLTVRSSQGVTLKITFLWSGSVKILSVQ